MNNIVDSILAQDLFGKKQEPLVVDSRYHFADTNARDTYFSLHPEEKVEDVNILVGTQLQQWQSVAWRSIDPIVKGVKGDIGVGMPLGGTLGQVVAKKSSSNFDFEYINLAGGGDMLKTYYDPTNKQLSLYSMNNMDETATKKILTAIERTKLDGIAIGAQVNTSKFKVSSNDTTENYLQAKLIAGTNISVTVNSEGGEESLSINSNITTDATIQGTGTVADPYKITTHTTNVNNPHSVTKSQVGLSNVDNVSDANKPVSSYTLTALNLKANLESPTFTGIISGITKSMVGLTNVNDTSDLSKPISNLTQASLDVKQTVFTGVCQEQYLTENDIVIDNTNRTLTIATVKNGQVISALNPICFFTDGNGTSLKHTKTTPVQFTFTDTSGVWYFYFNSSGNPIATQSIWTDFSTIATVYRMYWNATLPVADKDVIESVEYHKNDISWSDHAWKHSEGTRWLNGFEMYNNKLATGSPNADGRNAVIALSTGTNIDDNLFYTVSNAQTGITKFTQDLGENAVATLNATNSAQLICRSNDSLGLLGKIPATRFPFLWNSGTNRPEYMTTLGVRTPVTNTYFFVYYVYALQDPRRGETIKTASSFIDYANATLASASSWEEMQSVYPTLKDGEIRLLYKLTYETRYSGGGAYNVGSKYSVLRSVDDLRRQKTTTTAIASGSLPATSVTVVPFGTQTATNAQTAIDGIVARLLYPVLDSFNVAFLPKKAEGARIDMAIVYANVEMVAKTKITIDYEGGWVSDYVLKDIIGYYILSPIDFTALSGKVITITMSTRDVRGLVYENDLVQTFNI